MAGLRYGSEIRWKREMALTIDPVCCRR